MNDQTLTITVPTDKSFEDACVAVRQASEAAKWGVLSALDFGEILASKGHPQPFRMRAYDICSPNYANQMLAVDRRVGLCIPCRVLVTSDEGKTTIRLVEVRHVLKSVFPHLPEAANAMLEQIEGELRGIVRAAAAS